MKLLAPASSLSSINEQINNGADEIYIGVATEWGKNVSFAARGNYKRDNTPMVLNMDELGDAVHICHESNIVLHITMNSLHPTGFLTEYNSGSSGKDSLSYLKFIDFLAKKGVSNVIIADITAIKLVTKYFPGIFITASNVLEINNSETTIFLSELGVKRIVLPYQITLEEIIKIRNTIRDLEIEVFGHYGCSFHDGYCMFKHNVGEAGYEGINVGTPCCNYYILKDKNSSELTPDQYLDSSLVCSLCAIPELMNNNIDVIKLVGREMAEASNGEICRTYRKVIDLAKEKTTNTTYNDIKQNLPIWWERSLCREKRCKYNSDLPIVSSFVGTSKIKYQPGKASAHYDNLSGFYRINDEEIRLPFIDYPLNSISGEIRFIGLGFEYCSIPWHDPEKIEEKCGEILSISKKPLLITPCLKAEEFDLISSNIIKVLRNIPDIDLVVNDYGLMRKLKKEQTNKTGLWWFGRLLSRKMNDWPWFNIIMRSEEKEIIEKYSTPNTHHPEFIKIFSEYNIKGIELNDYNNIDSVLPFYRQNNISVKIHREYILAGVSRACINLKHSRNKINTCSGYCRIVEYQLDSLNSGINNKMVNKEIFPGLTVKGAGIFIENPAYRTNQGKEK